MRIEKFGILKDEKLNPSTLKLGSIEHIRIRHTIWVRSFSFRVIFRKSLKNHPNGLNIVAFILYDERRLQSVRFRFDEWLYCRLAACVRYHKYVFYIIVEDATSSDGGGDDKVEPVYIYDIIILFLSNLYYYVLWPNSQQK